MNPFPRVWEAIGADVRAAAEAVGRSGRYVLGAEVAAFEAAFAEAVGATHAVGLACGMDALEIGLRVLGLEPEEPVLTTPLTAFPTTLAILRAGGRPVFVDVDDAGLLDLDACDAHFRAHPRHRFLLPVHLYGRSLDLARLARLRDAHGLRIVEDAAQAHGATRAGRRVGRVGQVTAYSFYPTKNLGALGDAGALTTDDAALAETARALRSCGATNEALGLNSRLDELQAAILRRVMLPRLAAFTERRRTLARRYGEALTFPGIAPLPAHEGAVHHLYPVRVPAEEREAFRAFLAARGVETLVHYPRLTARHEAVADEAAVLARAEALAASLVSLPIHPALRDDEVERVVSACRAWSDHRAAAR